MLCLITVSDQLGDLLIKLPFVITVVMVTDQ